MSQCNIAAVQQWLLCHGIEVIIIINLNGYIKGRACTRGFLCMSNSEHKGHRYHIVQNFDGGKY